METQFKEMNFDNINESTWLRYHYTTKFPYNGLIASAFNESGKVDLQKQMNMIVQEIIMQL